MHNICYLVHNVYGSDDGTHALIKKIKTTLHNMQLTIVEIGGPYLESSSSPAEFEAMAMGRSWGATVMKRAPNIRG
jgi:hypothetical protein